MQIPFSFLQRSEKNQIKDLAFFQILKRKGPYIQRSLIRIQNDLIYKHKINANKITNVSFIKEIRQNLSIYQVIINQIKNDFLMTQLDSLGQGIHQLFSQMITIIKFFVDIILKKQKIDEDKSEILTLVELKQKEAQLKKLQQQQKLKDKEKQKENERIREMQKLKFNFRQLFKMESKTQNNHKLYEVIWKSIVHQTKISAQKCMTIQNVEMNKIIKDSCQFLYKNHSQLDNIIRLSKQEIIQGEKVINSFEDCNLIIDNNLRKINNMKKVANQIVQHVRQKVYQNKCVATQTNNTQVNSKKPMMTIRQLQQRRKIDQTVRRLDLQNLNLRRNFQQLSNNYRKLQNIANRKSFSKGNYSKNDDQDDQDSNNNIESTNNILNVQKFTNLQRKSKTNAYNSFKISSKSVNKFRQVSFTVGKQPFRNRNSQYLNLSRNQEKSSNRSSKTDKDMRKKRNLMLYPQTDTKLQQIRNSCVKSSEIKSIQQLSKRSDKSSHQQESNNVNKQQNKKLSLILNQTISSKKQIKPVKDNENSKQFQIFRVISILYKPKKLRIFSRHLKEGNQQVKESLIQNFNKNSKFKFQKAKSQYNKHKYYFQPYKEINQRYISAKKQINLLKSMQINHQTNKKRSNSFNNCQKTSKINKKQFCSNTPQLAVTSVIKIKSDRFKKQEQNQNKCIRKGIAKTRKQLMFHFQKQRELTRPAVTFSDLKQVQELKLTEDLPVSKVSQKFIKLQV